MSDEVTLIGMDADVFFKVGDVLRLGSGERIEIREVLPDGITVTILPDDDKRDVTYVDFVIFPSIQNVWFNNGRR